MWKKHRHPIRRLITHELKTDHAVLKLVERPGSSEFDAVLYAEPLDKVQICRISAQDSTDARKLAMEFARKCLDAQAKRIETIRLELEEGDKDVDAN